SLNEGEYAQIVQDDNIRRSIVLADKPVGVYVGMDLMVLGLDSDTSAQMVPPVRLEGSQYVAVAPPQDWIPYDDNTILPPVWQLVGAVDGTVLTYEPFKPNGAPQSLAAQQLVEFASNTPFVVRSQDADHPFYMAVYRAGHAPEYVTLVPPVQFRYDYVFA